MNEFGGQRERLYTARSLEDIEAGYLAQLRNPNTPHRVKEEIVEALRRLRESMAFGRSS